MNLDDKEHARRAKEYEAAVSMLQDTGQTVWVINGSYLLAETVMLGLLAQGLVSTHDLSGLLAIGAMLGLAISIFWWASFERAYGFYNLRINAARELEATLGYHVLSKGKDLSDGQKVRVGDQDIQIPWLARWGGIQDWTERLIWTFALTFVAILVFSAWRYTHRAAPILLARQASFGVESPSAPLLVTIVEIVSAAVIALFAVLQWWLSKRAEEARRAEREADRLERADTAYATVNAEYFRIWTVSQQWKAADLTSAAVVTTKSPDDILPRDWPSLTQNLAQLGYWPAHIGGVGLALAHEASRHARALFEEAVAYDQMRPAGADAAAAFEREHLPRLRDAETKLKDLATEAANVLVDALAHAPSAKRLRQPPEWNEVLVSEYARAIKAKIEGLQAKVEGQGEPIPLTGEGESGAGWFASWLTGKPRESQSALLQAQLDEHRQAPLRRLASLSHSLLGSLRQLPGPGSDAQSRADSLIRGAMLPREEDLQELRKLAAIDPVTEQLARAVAENFAWLLGWARQWQATNPAAGFEYQRINWPEWVFRWTEAEQALKKLAGG
jgi:hypothetical protein